MIQFKNNLFLYQKRDLGSNVQDGLWRTKHNLKTRCLHWDGMNSIKNMFIQTNIPLNTLINIYNFGEIIFT